MLYDAETIKLIVELYKLNKLIFEENDYET